MTTFDRLVRRLSAQRKPLLKDVELLVAYHTQLISLTKYHGLSDQWYIARYYLDRLSYQLHGTQFDYSALVIQPDEEVVRLEKLLKRYRKILKKRKFFLTFWYWRKTGHKVPDNFPEMQKFMTWYERRLQRRKQRV